jgi:hypothetical protein
MKFIKRFLLFSLIISPFLIVSHIRWGVSVQNITPVYEIQQINEEGKKIYEDKSCDFVQWHESYKKRLPLFLIWNILTVGVFMLTIWLVGKIILWLFQYWSVNISKNMLMYISLLLLVYVILRVIVGVSDLMTRWWCIPSTPCGTGCSWSTIWMIYKLPLGQLL